VSIDSLVITVTDNLCKTAAFSGSKILLQPISSLGL